MNHRRSEDPLAARANDPLLIWSEPMMSEDDRVRLASLDHLLRQQHDREQDAAMRPVAAEAARRGAQACREALRRARSGEEDPS